MVIVLCTVLQPKFIWLEVKSDGIVCITLVLHVKSAKSQIQTMTDDFQ